MVLSWTNIIIALLPVMAGIAGTTLKDLVRAALDENEVSLIIDNR